MFKWFRRDKSTPPQPAASGPLPEALPQAAGELPPVPEESAVADATAHAVADAAPPAAEFAPVASAEPAVQEAPAVAEPVVQLVEVPAAPPEDVPAMFVADEPAPAASEPPKPRSLRERLAATARALTASVGSLFKRNPKLDEDLLEELETALIQADIGVTAATELVEQLRVRMKRREFADAQALLASLRASLRALIVDHARPLVIPPAPRPFVILTVGVNGAGKTTTIGKLAMRYKQAGHSVMLAAGDTFRAAAVEQLKTWGERNQVTVVAQGSGADSASVIFDAFQAAKSRGIDVLIADTAGRLHTQGHLMQELAKVKRVLGKIDADAPHETLLVIDGGTGQNALNQARQFHQAVGLSGIVVTKLDGTAKGGMVFALCRELNLPIRFIGVGEKREDLREFNADDFVEALLPRELGQA
jgi:fused signal recognition particle receptor